MPDGDDESAQWREALGNDPAYKTDTSAALLARAGTGIPSTIAVVRGTALRRSIENGFVEKPATDHAG